MNGFPSLHLLAVGGFPLLTSGDLPYKGQHGHLFLLITTATTGAVEIYI